MSFFRWPLLPQETHKTQNRSTKTPVICHRTWLGLPRRCTNSGTGSGSPGQRATTSRPTASSPNQPSPTVSKLFVFSCRSGIFSNYWSIQTTWVSSHTADTRKENPRSWAPNCSGAGEGRSQSIFLTFIYYNNLTGRWPHYFPTRDLFLDILIPNHICILYKITHLLSNHSSLCSLNHSTPGLIKYPERTAPSTYSANKLHLKAWQTW